jgi:Cu+-exporting ATPase
MKCGGCAGRLQRALQDAQGVAQAAVSLETRKARVQGSISEARLRELIQQAGFKAV